MSNIAKFVIGGLLLGYVGVMGYVFLKDYYQPAEFPDIPSSVSAENKAKGPLRADGPVVTPATPVVVEEPAVAADVAEPAPTVVVEAAPAPSTSTEITAEKVVEPVKKVVTGTVKIVEGAGKVINKTIDNIAKTIDSAKCTTAKERHTSHECDWVRDHLAEQGVPRYKDHYEQYERNRK